jgi:hypothetical protein
MAPTIINIKSILLRHPIIELHNNMVTRKYFSQKKGKSKVSKYPFNHFFLRVLRAWLGDHIENIFKLSCNKLLKMLKSG